MSKGWFEVDTHGLAKLVRRKGAAFILHELIQNAWDTDATRVMVELTPIGSRPMARLVVADNDPKGFERLEHGFTLFAESLKKGDPNKRGRFNLGEKLVIARCESARLQSTTGTLYFERVRNELKRRETRERLPEGSRFEAEIRMTREELEEVLDASRRLLPPIPTWINDEQLPEPKVIDTLTVALPTEVANEDGVLRRSVRKTTVRIVPRIGDVAYVYEMGIPVVEIDLPWSVDVEQKIPLNQDRDNITPAFRKLLVANCLNQMHSALTQEQAALPLVQEALGHDHISDDAVQAVVASQYGAERVVYDPSDLEAGHNATAHGYAVIHGGAYSREQWANIKRAGAALPAGRVFPTPRCYDPEGDPAKQIPEESEWTNGMRVVALYMTQLAVWLLNIQLEIVMENERGQSYLANYSRGSRASRLTFSIPALGRAWFNLSSNFIAINDLMLHEFAHQANSNHLAAAYHEALSHLGAKMVEIALREPAYFDEVRRNRDWEAVAGKTRILL
jgi:hypothetical protein